MRGYFGFVEFEPKTWGIGKFDVAVFLTGEAIENSEVVLGVELGVILLNLEVDDRCIEVHFGHRTDGRADVVRRHCDVLCFGDDCYFL